MLVTCPRFWSSRSVALMVSCKLDSARTGVGGATGAEGDAGRAAAPRRESPGNRTAFRDFAFRDSRGRNWNRRPGRDCGLHAGETRGGRDSGVSYFWRVAHCCVANQPCAGDCASVSDFRDSGMAMIFVWREERRVLPCATAVRGPRGGQNPAAHGRANSALPYSGRRTRDWDRTAGGTEGPPLQRLDI